MIRYWKGQEETLFGMADAIRIWCPECGQPNSGSLDVLNGRKAIMCSCGFNTPMNIFASGTPSDAMGNPVGKPAVTKAEAPKDAPKLESPSAPATPSAATAPKPPEMKVPDAKPRAQVFPADKAK